MNWTAETYRLDEVTKRFPPPCVICVTEGFYSETDAESMSSGDIIKIDKELTLHKVAANFASDVKKGLVKERVEDYSRGNYANLVHTKEILVPLNYKGKLKVKTEIKHFGSVLELSKDFPKYAKLKENLNVTTKEGSKIEIQAGTVIQLDRTIPGEKRLNRPDKLVIQFDHLGSPLVVSVPFTEKGKFKTEPDENEYTLKETVDKFKLPQTVRFVDDEIKRVYSENIEEGVGNKKAISETLRLNRLVIQDVLVGHYKPLEGAAPDTDESRQRTLIVIPLDLPDIREIDVHVLQGATEDDYATIFSVRNITSEFDLGDQSLYVDFALEPGIKRLANKKTPASMGIGKHRDYVNSGPKPPPGTEGLARKVNAHRVLPPIPNSEVPEAPPRPSAKPVSSSPASPKVSGASQGHLQSSDEDYEIPVISAEAPALPPRPSIKLKPSLKSFGATQGPSLGAPQKCPPVPVSGQPLPGVIFKPSFDADYVEPTIGPPPPRVGKGKQPPSRNVGTKPLTIKKDDVGDDDAYVTMNVLQDQIQPRKEQAKIKPNKKYPPKSIKVEDLENTDAIEKDADDNPYDYVDDKLMEGLHRGKHPPIQERPVAFVVPRSPYFPLPPRDPVKATKPTIKQFYDLSVHELEERLLACGLKKLAKICKHKTFDGNFFRNLKSTDLEKPPFKLTGFDLMKFEQIREHNWVPTE